MKKALSLLVAALLVMGWSGISEAKNYYVSGNIGLVWFDDLDLYNIDIVDIDDIDGEDDDDYIKTLFDSGIALTAAIGCDLGNVRGELEMGYQVNDAVEALDLQIRDDKRDDSDGGWDNSEKITGDVSLVTFMFNGYYDIPLDDSGLELFVTAGVGSAFWRFDEIGDAKDSPEESEERATENGSTWAYQFGAGISYPVGDNLMLEARYRYFNTAEFTTADDNDFLDDIGNDDPYNGDIASHSALVGLRYNF